jgi:hypothetical protein
MRFKNVIKLYNLLSKIIAGKKEGGRKEKKILKVKATERKKSTT